MSNVIDTLTTDEQLRIRQSSVRLQREFEGRLNAETVERFMTESIDMLLPRARTRDWIVLLAERFSRDRLRALLRLDHRDATLTPSVLFLCVHNAGRSQMAAGWMRALAGNGVEVFSGGSEPAEAVNAAAVAAMAEVGVDISEELPQPWSDEIVRAADVVVTMGCGDACPVFPGLRYVDWELEDPAGKSVEDVRPIRDDIERRVRGLLSELEVEPIR
jgi:arsenate reductase (thioredoxin)